jgi:tRNA nucleotidyltransferase (CCA-adding enzyme)
MPDLERVKSQALAKIKPKKEEEERVREFSKKIIAAAKDVSGLDSVICGSIGKSTWLAGDHDVDLFMLFPKDLSRDVLEDKGLSYGKKIVAKLGGKWIIKYAEHPYVHAIIKGFDVDVVPCYRIAKGEHIKSAVDRSPLHLEYILAHLKHEHYDDVRLLKQFCKGIGVYGSDAKSMGVSGYICELLILKYGNFESALAQIAGWSAQQLVHLGTEPVKAKFPEPLVIIDPVDHSRNAAAAVSPENFVRLINGAKKFLKGPDASFFWPDEQELSAAEIRELQKRGTHWIGLVFPKPDVIEDVLWPQMRRCLRRFDTILKEREFHTIRRYAFADGDAVLFFELEVWEMPRITHMAGPPIKAAEHAGHFLEKYSDAEYGPFVEEAAWRIERERKHKTAADMFRYWLKKSSKTLEAEGIPSFVAKAIARNSKVLEGGAFWSYAKKNKELSKFLRKQYFERLL